MAQHVNAKRELVVEAVRQGLEGDDAIEFIRQSGYAMTQAGVARHLRLLGGRGRVQELINDGKSTLEILQICLPDEDFSDIEQEPPDQGELFSEDVIQSTGSLEDRINAPLYETTRMSIRLPADLYEAIRVAAKVERKSQNLLIVEILESALSQMPRPEMGEGDDISRG